MRYLFSVFFILLVACSGNTDANVQTPADMGGVSGDMAADLSAQGDTCIGSDCDPDPDACDDCADGTECIEGECVAVCGGAETYCAMADGFECCADGTGCFFEKCVELFDTCDEDNPCPFTQFCEPTVGRCINVDEDPNACIFQPPVGDFDPVEAFSWTGSPNDPTFDQVMMMPVVANMTDDNGDGAIDENDVPDILFTTFAGSGYTLPGVLRVISGDDGREHWSSTSLPVPYDVQSATSPAVADIDEDGFPEIVIDGGTAGGVYALEHDGAIKWHRPDVRGNQYGSASFANIDGAGPPEIVTSMHVLSADGDRICDLGNAIAAPTIADLDMDGVQEIILGTAIYTFVDPTATDGSGCGGYSAGFGAYHAIANLDDDPFPEIIISSGGALAMLEHDGTETWRVPLPIDQPRLDATFGPTDCAPGAACTLNDECGGEPARCIGGACVAHWACMPGGGAPTIADFDGDRQPEIAIAGRWYYLVYEADGSVVWAHKTQDYSSAVTGSSVFDFEGDGRAEVVYNDEQFLRVYSGPGTADDADGDGFNDPEILLEIPNTSGTLLEYPLIVDVDNDGSAEIVLMANSYAFASDTTGIRVFKDAGNNWVGTRRIWNQHSYHVTNIEEDASVPVSETPNWTVPWLNNYRQNVQGGNPLNAPNFVPEIDEVDGVNCATSGLVVRFTVRNAGSIGVRAGALDTTVLAGETGTALSPIATVTNTVALGPGGSESFEVTWTPPESLIGKGVDVEVITDYGDDGSSRHNECIEDDNTTALPNTVCMVPQ